MTRVKEEQSLEPYLSQAERALDDNDPSTAARALVCAWGLVACQQDRIADILDRLAPRLPAPEPFKEKTLVLREETWFKLAKKLDSNDVPRLLLLEWPPYSPAARRRLGAFAMMPPDPRVVRSLITLLKSDRYAGHAGRAFWCAAFDVLYKWRYAGVHEMFAAFARRSRFERRLQRPRIESADLDEQSMLMLAKLEERLGASKEREEDRKARGALLLDAVYETPDDDGARLVYADFLMEESDPDQVRRGTFIELDIRLANEGKLARAALKEHTALCRMFGRQWQEGIDRSLTQVVLGRGFPSKATVVRGERCNPSTRLHRTIRTLVTFNPFEFSSPMKTLPFDIPLPANLGGVRELLYVEIPLFIALLERGGGFAFHHLDLRGLGPQWREAKVPASHQISTRRLSVSTTAVAEIFLERGIFESLGVTELGLTDEPPDNFSFVAQFIARLPASFVRIDMSRANNAWVVRLDRGLGASQWRATVKWTEKAQPSPDARARITALLQQTSPLGGSLIEQVTFVDDKGDIILATSENV